MIDGYVKYFARELRRAAPPELELDDLISIGTLGLIESTTRHDPATGVPFGAFTRHEVRAAMIEALREASRHLEVEGTDGDRIPSPLDLEDQISARELRARVANAVAALPEAEATVLATLYYEDRSLADVAEALGLEPPDVDRLRRSALRRLRRRLTPVA